jgi:large subunit ribosomal protein L10
LDEDFYCQNILVWTLPTGRWTLIKDGDYCMPTKQKIESVAHLTDQLQKAKAVVFTDYRGLSVAQVENLRTELAKHDATFEVTKNSLINIAAKQAAKEVEPSVLEGPTATLFAFGDEVAPLKALVDFAKEANLPTVKAGFLGSTVLSAAQVSSLASLPSREMLIAKTVGTIKAPLTGLVNVLQGNTRGLVYALAAIRDQKQA